MTVKVKLSQVSVVHAAGVAVAPVNGPQLNETEVVWPAAGAFKVPLDGVAAKAEDTTTIRASVIARPNAFLLFILIPPGGSGA